MSGKYTGCPKVMMRNFKVGVYIKNYVDSYYITNVLIGSHKPLTMVSQQWFLFNLLRFTWNTEMNFETILKLE